MAETILNILGISILVAIPASVIVLSMEAGRPYIKELLSNPKLMIRYFSVMFVIVPAIALALYFFDTDNRNTWMAVLVISLSPASPGMLKNINKLSGELNISIAWMILAIFISFIMLPVNLYIITNILGITIDFGIDDVMKKLFVLFILPMLAGFFISRYFPKYVPKFLKTFDLISKTAMIVLIICALIIAVPILINKGIVSFVLIFVFLLISLGISTLLESPDKKYGPVLAYSVVLRLPAPALVLASINGMTMVYAADIIIFLLEGLILMKIYNKMFYSKSNLK